MLGTEHESEVAAPLQCCVYEIPHLFLFCSIRSGWYLPGVPVSQGVLQLRGLPFDSAARYKTQRSWCAHVAQFQPCQRVSHRTLLYLLPNLP